MSESKRIVVYSEYFYPMFCGVPMSSRNIARSLLELGHQVSVYTPMSVGEHEELDEGYPIVRGKDWRKLTQDGPVDIVLINNGNFSLKGFLLGRWLKASVIQWFQMTYVPKVKVTPKGVFNEFVEKAVSGSVSAYVGVSQLALESRPWIPSRKPKKVVFNVGEALFSELPIPGTPRDFDFVFVGRMTEAKGMLVLADAIKLLESEKVASSVLMVGDGELRGELETLSESNHYSKIHFAGVQRGANLVACYDRSKAFLFTTTTHPEGLPLVLAEAAMRALPIISSDHPVALEAVGRYAQIYKSESAAELAALMRDFVRKESDEQGAGGGESEAIRERFSFSTLKKQLKDLLSAV